MIRWRPARPHAVSVDEWGPLGLMFLCLQCPLNGGAEGSTVIGSDSSGPGGITDLHGEVRVRGPARCRSMAQGRRSVVVAVV